MNRAATLALILRDRESPVDYSISWVVARRHSGLASTLPRQSLQRQAPLQQRRVLGAGQLDLAPSQERQLYQGDAPQYRCSTGMTSDLEHRGPGLAASPCHS
jgi:hypothetical protein